ncbi:FecR domain-containing protein [Calycomorphotria hydatis]|uniref:FecR protein n=1 Tax=Calycomorphotria hydatis TaxID=2528027 RepID=A0A517T8M0_9PLAN|nr:FecR family protein [Calycomorphotria hydatis]QDT64713.1 FecR protein [Calycomorphotria hydatis]
MKSSEALRQEVISLAGAMCEGVADHEQVGRLNQLLAHDIRSRQWFVEVMDLQACLYEISEQNFLSNAVVQAVEYRRTSRRPLAFKLSLAVTTAVLLIAVSTFMFLQSAPLPATARLTVLSQDALWSGEQQNLGTVIRETDRLQLEHGTAVFESPNGVLMQIMGPTALTWIDEDNIQLRRGELIATVPPAGIGFSVQTDDMKLVDLGTSFHVRRREGYGTEVSVYKGRVKTALLDPVQGNAVREFELTTNRSAVFDAATLLAEETAFPEEVSQLFESSSLTVRELLGSVRLVKPSAFLVQGDSLLTGSEFLLLPESANVVINEAINFDSKGRSYSVPAGQQVNSFLFHFHPKADINSEVVGSVTFQTQIVAVITDSNDLNSTDDLLGLPTISYSGDSLRGLEDDGDALSLSEDGRTLTFHPTVFGTNRLDQVRILTQAR